MGLLLVLGRPATAGRLRGIDRCVFYALPAEKRFETLCFLFTDFHDRAAFGSHSDAHGVNLSIAATHAANSGPGSSCAERARARSDAAYQDCVSSRPRRAASQALVSSRSTKIPVDPWDSWRPGVGCA